MLDAEPNTCHKNRPHIRSGDPVDQRPGRAATSPYCANKEGKGPAWSNSLFEDNAEHGYGMFLGQQALRNRLAEKVREVAEKTTDDARKAACQAYLDTMDDLQANNDAANALIVNLEANVCCDTVKEILKDKEYLAKKSIWIFGGDGWAYDIGFGGVDHVLASAERAAISVVYPKEKV